MNGSAVRLMRKPEPIVISFFTEGTGYRLEADRLRESCVRFGLDHSISGIASKGDWVQNCSMKGPFIEGSLTRFKRPVLWVDADGEIVQRPDFSSWAQHDVACYVQRSTDGTPPPMNSAQMPFMSGTVFVNFTPGGLALASRWARLCEANPTVWDQTTLAAAWWEVRERTRLLVLPQGYCKIYDRIWREPERRAYVVHHQASRRLRGAVSRTRSADAPQHQGPRDGLDHGAAPARPPFPSRATLEE